MLCRTYLIVVSLLFHAAFNTGVVTSSSFLPIPLGRIRGVRQQATTATASSSIKRMGRESVQTFYLVAKIVAIFSRAITNLTNAMPLLVTSVTFYGMRDIARAFLYWGTSRTYS